MPFQLDLAEDVGHVEDVFFAGSFMGTLVRSLLVLFSAIWRQVDFLGLLLSFLVVLSELKRTQRHVIDVGHVLLGVNGGVAAPLDRQKRH